MYGCFSSACAFRQQSVCQHDLLYAYIRHDWGMELSGEYLLDGRAGEMQPGAEIIYGIDICQIGVDVPDDAAE